MLPSTVVQTGESAEEAAIRAWHETTGMRAEVKRSLGTCADKHSVRHYFLGVRTSGEPNTGAADLKTVCLPMWDSVQRLTSPYDMGMILNVSHGIRTSLHNREYPKLARNTPATPTDEKGHPLMLATHCYSIPLFDPEDPCYAEDRRAAAHAAELAGGSGAKFSGPR
jgi:ADP-ribose pyrophosphatase YjhB (NUDIX family)